MKLRTMIMMAGALIVFASIHASAQSQDAGRVKILRTANPDVIKVLYAKEMNEPLSITFFNQDGEVGNDKVSGNFPTGFSKKYNVSDIRRGNFWIEVASGNATIVYRVAPSRDGRSFTASLEKEIYRHEVIASK